jgi:hydrogenase nickel incorporation protein HypA/HybF
MHELAIVQSVVEDIADRLGSTRVTKVTLEIGTLSGVVVPSIEFCFDLVAAGTTLEGAALVVHSVVGQARCRSCGTRFSSSDPIVLCPTCVSSDVDVLAGREMRIKSVEVITPCAPPAAAR